MATRSSTKPEIPLNDSEEQGNHLEQSIRRLFCSAGRVKNLGPPQLCLPLLGQPISNVDPLGLRAVADSAGLGGFHQINCDWTPSQHAESHSNQASIFHKKSLQYAAYEDSAHAPPSTSPTTPSNSSPDPHP